MWHSLKYGLHYLLKNNTHKSFENSLSLNYICILPFSYYKEKKHHPHFNADRHFKRSGSLIQINMVKHGISDSSLSVSKIFIVQTFDKQTNEYNLPIYTIC
jgi:hypothetical protein